MDIIKGSTTKFVNTVYSDYAALTIANIAGASVKMYVKLFADDLDVNALINKNGTVTDGPNGLCEVLITAADTNTLTSAQTDLVYEIVVKLADGVTFYRSGVMPFNVLTNVIKTLF